MVKNVFKKLGKKQKNNKGFSLVELIVVIAIMAVLVGVLAPQLIKYVEKSREATDIQNCDSIATALKTYYSDKEDVTADVSVNVTADGVVESTEPAVKDAGLENTKLKGTGWTSKSGDKVAITITYKHDTGKIEYTATSAYYSANGGDQIKSTKNAAANAGGNQGKDNKGEGKGN